MTRSAQNTRRGFTLMEVLVVLAILVMLVGMAVPKILERYKQANVNNAKIQVGSFYKALDLYYNDVKNYPTTEQGLAALVERPSDLEESVPWTKSMDEVPNDPWGRPYKYSFEPGDEKPRVWSSGPDGEDDTDDDVTFGAKTSGEGGSESGGTSGSSSVKL